MFLTALLDVDLRMLPSRAAAVNGILPSGVFFFLARNAAVCSEYPDTIEPFFGGGSRVAIRRNPCEPGVMFTACNTSMISIKAMQVSQTALGSFTDVLLA